MWLFEICEIISDQQQIPAMFQRSDTRPKDLIGDVSVMKEKLHVPEIPFDKGIKDLIF